MPEAFEMPLDNHRSGPQRYVTFTHRRCVTSIVALKQCTPIEISRLNFVGHAVDVVDRSIQEVSRPVITGWLADMGNFFELGGGAVVEDTQGYGLWPQSIFTRLLHLDCIGYSKSGVPTFTIIHEGKDVTIQKLTGDERGWSKDSELTKCDEFVKSSLTYKIFAGERLGREAIDPSEFVVLRFNWEYWPAIIDQQKRVYDNGLVLPVNTGGVERYYPEIVEPLLGTNGTLEELRKLALADDQRLVGLECS